MPKYAVIRSGANCTIANSWDEAKKLCYGVPGSYSKKFDTEEKAQDYIKTILDKRNNVSKTNNLLIGWSEAETTVSDKDRITEVENLKQTFCKQVDAVQETFDSLRNIVSDITSHVPASDDISKEVNSFVEYTKLKLSNISRMVLTKLQGASVESSVDRQMESPTKKGRKRTKQNKELESTESSNSSTIENKKIKKTNDPEDEEDLTYDPDGFLVVYTDGSCTNNGRHEAQAGIGVWFGPRSPYNVAEPVKGVPTNNNAEIQAATKAISVAKELGIKKLRVYTDSKFTISCMTEWIHNWRSNGWTLSSGGPVKNREELMVLDKEAQQMEHIDWRYVKGHDTSVGNQNADQLARTGAKLYVPTGPYLGRK